MDVSTTTQHRCAAISSPEVHALEAGQTAQFLHIMPDNRMTSFSSLLQQPGAPLRVERARPSPQPSRLCPPTRLPSPASQHRKLCCYLVHHFPTLQHQMLDNRTIVRRMDKGADFLTLRLADSSMKHREGAVMSRNNGSAAPLLQPLFAGAASTPRLDETRASSELVEPIPSADKVKISRS